MDKVMFAVLMCVCKYETGYQVKTLHNTEQAAIDSALHLKKERGECLDGITVVKFNPNTVDFSDAETFTIVQNILASFA